MKSFRQAMLGFKLACITAIVLAGCMAKPKQPPLTEKEARYINELALSCHCDVRRELDPRKPEERLSLNDKYWYAVTFTGISCNELSHKDSLKVVSIEVAKKLHQEVLRGFEYPYDFIVVSFVCNENATIQRSEDFEYQLQELDGE